MNNKAIKESKLIRHKKTHTFYTKSVIMCILFVSLVVIDAVKGRTYIDEIIGILSMFYIALSRKRMERNDIIAIVLLFLTVIIGLLSNLMYEVVTSWFSIATDVIAETKVIMAFFATKYFLTDNEKQSIIDLLVIPAKIYSIVAFICAFISMFVNIGMSNSSRYGINNFIFFYNTNIQFFSTYILVLGVLVCNNKMTEKQKIKYYVFSLFSLFLGLKASNIIIVILFIIFAIYFKKHSRLNLGIIVLVAVSVYIAGKFQIETYLANEASPRYLFFKYGAITANEYFPLGSGFSTFGSDQAARNYSPLYLQYGFDNLHGMSPQNPAFLSDTFWAMAIAQFGWIGFIIYISIYIMIFLSFSNKQIASTRKAFLYAVYIQFLIHAIGSAMLSSSAGLWSFMALSVFTIIDKDENGAIKLPKIRIRY